MTPEEYETVKEHPAQGVKIIEPLHSLGDVIPLIRWHHERLDGGGYPDGLSGQDIPFLVRILSVADVYDALASDRPYRGPIPYAKCLELLRADAAKGGLDADLVDSFCDIPPASIMPGAPPPERRLAPVACVAVS